MLSKVYRTGVRLVNPSIVKVLAKKMLVLALKYSRS